MLDSVYSILSGIPQVLQTFYVPKCLQLLQEVLIALNMVLRLSENPDSLCLMTLICGNAYDLIGRKQCFKPKCDIIVVCDYYLTIAMLGQVTSVVTCRTASFAAR